MELSFSIIVPVYNRPEEIFELLQSICNQKYKNSFEVVIVEDGSTISAAKVIKNFSAKLNITYLTKENTGPGDSRNFGMQGAKGNYFLILDSDCILPPNYLNEVANALEEHYVHCFGGADDADSSFTPTQKAINYALTSFWTTGGIRGSKKSVGKFQPRSFNMGISKEVFEEIGGFGQIHPGEDPDLTFRIWNAGYQTRFFPKAVVYHKRRVDFKRFYNQVFKFGQVRAVLNKWHPKTKRITYWFPTVFVLGLLLSLVFLSLGFWLFIALIAFYFAFLFFHSTVKNKSIGIGLLSVYAALVQFVGYGIGFFKSTVLLTFSSKSPEAVLPNLFFTKKG